MHPTQSDPISGNRLGVPLSICSHNQLPYSPLVSAYFGFGYS
ncbi:hypothetical protein PSAC2689_220006 [Paraburkholderia sacchari]